MLDALVMGKELREGADYRDDFSRDGAAELNRAASQWLQVSKTILGNRE
jgi:hypothetical protein